MQQHAIAQAFRGFMQPVFLCVFGRAHRRELFGCCGTGQVEHQLSGEVIGQHDATHLAERGDRLGLADLLTWVASDARREEAGLRRQVSTAVAGTDEDGEPLTFPNLVRWGPAFDAPDEAEEEDEEEDVDLGEGPFSPSVASTSSTSRTPPNRRKRRKAVARARKR